VSPVESTAWRWPAEWERHAASWLSWPHNHETWPHKFVEVEAAMVKVAVALSQVETVHINVLDAEHEAYVLELLDAAADMHRIETHLVPTNDAWIRDHGALIVTRRDGGRERAALTFVYNAWGGKYAPFDLDARVASRMGEILGVSCVAPGLVLEGGAIDGNGHGAILTTEQCLLESGRNASLDRAGYEAAFARFLGASEIIWLHSGISGDDTDGHVDQLARFVGPTRVVVAIEPDAADVNHAPLAANRRRLTATRLRTGESLEVVDVPMPAPVCRNGTRLPASYLNFYIANELVLVPAFGCREDREALDTIAACFPERRLVPIDCRGFVEGLGGVHCLTQQVPAIADGTAIS
jgi:agmatine deiminase